MENSRFKFRAWNEVLKEWVEPNAVHVNGLGICGFIDCVKGRFHEAAPHYKFMQFTGLYDKSGQEVFDGDIVKFSGDDHVRTAEEADRPIQTISWGSRGWNAPQSIETRWEVIGNIWES